MRNLFIVVLLTWLLSSCGTGVYSLSSGMADECTITFVSEKSFPIIAIIDDKEYNVSSVKHKAYKADRNIKKTSRNCIVLSPGVHDIKVLVGDNTIFSHKIFISAAEHKIIEL